MLLITRTNILFFVKIKYVCSEKPYNVVLIEIGFLRDNKLIISSYIRINFVNNLILNKLSYAYSYIFKNSFFVKISPPVNVKENTFLSFKMSSTCLHW